MPIQRPCLDCNTLTTNPTRCPTCTGKRQAIRNSQRTHYQGDYTSRSRLIRENATHCWICGQGPRPDDPWTADHIYGKDRPELAAAHRSCNSSRGARDQRPRRS